MQKKKEEGKKEKEISGKDTVLRLSVISGRPFILSPAHALSLSRF